MSSNRLEQLRSMLADDPEDKFLRYAIALERRRAGDRAGAAEDLESLLGKDPTFIACYYQLAQVLAEMGRTQDAIQTCDAGALQCLVAGDRKTRTELLSLRGDLEDTA